MKLLRDRADPDEDVLIEIDDLVGAVGELLSRLHEDPETFSSLYEVVDAVEKCVPGIASTIDMDEFSIRFHFPGKQIGMKVYFTETIANYTAGFEASYSILQHMSDEDEVGKPVEIANADDIVDDLEAMNRTYSTEACFSCGHAISKKHISDAGMDDESGYYCEEHTCKSCVASTDTRKVCCGCFELHCIECGRGCYCTDT